jgi:hypothetical protein
MFRARAIALGGSIGLAFFAAGCPRASAPAPPTKPTPRFSIPAPRIQARAHPAFRLVIPPRPVHAPTRLVAVFVRIENIHSEPLMIRPNSIRLELPDGSIRLALDKARAFAILKRSLLARFDPYDDGKANLGLSRSEQVQWERRFQDELLDDTRLLPGESVEGFIVVDTSRRFKTLDDTVVEAVAQPPEENGNGDERYPVRVLLGAPIEINP